MDILKNVLQKGSMVFTVDAGCRCDLKSASTATVVKNVDGVDEYVGSGKRIRFYVPETCDYEILVGDSVFWSLDYVHPDDVSEKLDPTPIEVVLDNAPSLEQQIKRMIRQEYARLAQTVERPGSFEDEDDFNVDDDDDMTSAYEVIDMVEDVIDGGEPELDPDKTPSLSPAEPEKPASPGALSASADK